MEKEVDKQQDRQFEQLIDKLRIIISSLESEEISKKVILLVGQASAGKTTLHYYLTGKPLKSEWNTLKACSHLVPEATHINAYIGESYQSTTIYPNVSCFHQTKQVIVIDMPCLRDQQREPLINMLKIFIWNQIFKLIKSIHILFVLPLESLDSNLEYMLENTFSILSEEFCNSKKCFSFILTKLRKNSGNKQQYSQALQVKKQFSESIEILKSSNPNFSQIFSTFDHQNIYEFANQETNTRQGKDLFQKIIQQNNFYQVNNQPEKILSKNYANSIKPLEHQAQFEQFSMRIITKVFQNLSLYALLATTMIQLQNAQSFDKIPAQKQIIKIKIMDILNIISCLDAYKRQKAKVFQKENLPKQIPTKQDSKNLIMKYYTILEHEDSQNFYGIKELIMKALMKLFCETDLTLLSSQFKKIVSCIFKILVLIVQKFTSLEMKPVNKLIQEQNFNVEAKMFQSFLQPFKNNFPKQYSEFLSKYSRSKSQKIEYSKPKSQKIKEDSDKSNSSIERSPFILERIVSDGHKMRPKKLENLTSHFLNVKVVQTMQTDHKQQMKAIIKYNCVLPKVKNNNVQQLIITMPSGDTIQQNKIIQSGGAEFLKFINEFLEGVRSYEKISIYENDRKLKNMVKVKQHYKHIDLDMAFFLPKNRKENKLLCKILSQFKLKDPLIAIIQSYLSSSTSPQAKEEALAYLDNMPGQEDLRKQIIQSIQKYRNEEAFDPSYYYLSRVQEEAEKYFYKKSEISSLLIRLTRRFENYSVENNRPNDRELAKELIKLFNRFKDLSDPLTLSQLCSQCQINSKSK